MSDRLPLWFERAEGATLFLLASGLFFVLHGGVLTYIVALLAVDISIVGYAAGPKVGAVIYNIFHNFSMPLILISLSLLSSNLLFLGSWALVWLAHIGLDRALGLGLKYPDAFGHTTLGTVGRRKS